MKPLTQKFVAYEFLSLYIAALAVYFLRVGAKGFWATSVVGIFALVALGIAGAMFILAAMYLGKFTWSTWLSVNLGDTTIFPLAIALQGSLIHNFHGTSRFYGQSWFYVGASTVFAIIYVAVREQPWIGISYLFGKSDANDSVKKEMRLSPPVIAHWFSSGVIAGFTFAGLIPALVSDSSLLHKAAWPAALACHFALGAYDLVTKKKPNPGAIW